MLITFQDFSQVEKPFMSMIRGIKRNGLRPLYITIDPIEFNDWSGREVGEYLMKVVEPCVDRDNGEVSIYAYSKV